MAAAAIGLLLSMAAGAWLIFSPCVYGGVEEEPVPAERSFTTESISGPGSGGSREGAFCAGSLIEVVGPGMLFLLAIPVALSLGGFVAALRDRKALVSAFAVTLVVCVFLGAFSIGIFYVPSALALIVAALLSQSNS